MQLTLPVIDLEPLRSGRPGDVPRQIGDACRNEGFFYIANHGVRSGLVEELFRVAREFYAQPEAEKRKVALGPETHWRGWTALGSEVTAGKRDWHECLDVMNEDEPSARSPFHGRNLWPASPASLRSIAWEYFQAMQRVGQTVLAGISLSCGLDRDFFAERFTADPWCLLRILRYPEQPESDGMGIGEHTDYGCVTLLDATAPGLSVRSRSGRWIDAPPRPGLLVCNLGDAMETWTYGVYKATPHRVVTRQERIAVPFFYDPSLDATIEPLEAFRSPGAAARPAFQYGPYLLAAYQRSYPALADRSQSRSGKRIR